MKTKVRRWAEKYYKEPKKRVPVYLGSGTVFIFPSRSAPLDRMHVVSVYERETPKGKILKEAVCSCEAFYHNGEDKCPHVVNLLAQIREAENKLISRGS